MLWVLQMIKQKYITVQIKKYIQTPKTSNEFIPHSNQQTRDIPTYLYTKDKTPE